MATFLDDITKELYEFFDAEIAPMIKTQKHEPALFVEISNKYIAKFGDKYDYIVRPYKDTIRISATYRPLGIVFFMAQTKEGSLKYPFCDPCYWGKGEPTMVAKKKTERADKNDKPEKIWDITKNWDTK
jgi:hypothetical protein